MKIKDRLALIPRVLCSEGLAAEDATFLRRIYKQGGRTALRADRQRLKRLLIDYAVTQPPQRDAPAAPVYEPGPGRTCPCGETFKPTREAQRFCSAACGSAYRMARMRSRNKDDAAGAIIMGAPIALHEEQFRASGPHHTGSLPVTKGRVIPNQDFQWRGLALHYCKRPVLTLVPDATFPHLYRIRYPDGWTSTPANLTRAKDAAYGHARYLLMPGEEAAA